MTGKGKPKPKKVIETSLGKAPKESDKAPDLSHLRKPITTSVHGLKQIISLFQTATTEVQEYITYECDVLYECKTCRTIFRSLANFILHKRNYCREKSQYGGGNNEGGFVINDDMKTSDEESRSATPLQLDSDSVKMESDVANCRKNEKRTILPIIDKLLKRQKIQIVAKDILNEDLSKAETSDDDVIFVSEETSVVLQKIDSSEAAVFQTKVRDCEKLEESKGELMKSEILEIHGILDNNQAVLGTNGKVSNIPKRNLVCTECNFTFSTEKTLTHHIKYKHNKTCIVFPCPDCKETFSNAWSVYRHLYKVHRRTTSQVKRMRYLVHSSGIRKDQEPERKKKKLNIEENEENQWMNNIEGDKDFQMCGGCGKRFERKAALHSHSQMCTKRIALCNSIKNVKAAKNEKKEAETKPKGAAKRKSVFVQHITEEKEGTCNRERRSDKTDEPRETTSDEPQITITKSDVTITKDDITITKHNDTDSIQLAQLPEIEIYTISDDSNDEKKRFNLDSVEISDEYKKYVNDEDDYCLLSKISSSMDQTELKCTSCGLDFMSVYMLLRHMSLHISWFRFQCSKCSFMSFHKYDCTAHAYSQHRTPKNLMDSTVLPIPKWKVLYTSHDFTTLSEDLNEETPDLIKTMPRLEAIEEANEAKTNGVYTTETIILEDDEMPDICTEHPETVFLSDDERENEKKKGKAGPSKIVNDRPIRNRTKSVKTVQNDFIYDLGKALKLNDNSVKNKKVKKNLGKV